MDISKEIELILAINPVPQGRFHHSLIFNVEQNFYSLAINPVPQGRFHLSKLKAINDR